MEDVDGVATESAQLGKQLNERLTTPGIKLEALRRRRGPAEQQQQILTRTEQLSPPGRSSSSRRRWSRRCSSG